MPVVQLEPIQEAGVTIPTVDGGVLDLRQRRLRTWVKIGSHHAIYLAVLDTGAPTCIFSRLVWEKFDEQGLIEWVGHPPPARDGLPRTTLMGGTFPFRLGRVMLQIVGAAVGDELPPVPVLVQCLEDEGVLPRTRLIGLEGVLNGRTLTVAASADGAEWVASLAE